jgi:hypothetical protein
MRDADADGDAIKIEKCSGQHKTGGVRRTTEAEGRMQAKPQPRIDPESAAPTACLPAQLSSTVPGEISGAQSANSSDWIRLDLTVAAGLGGQMC